MEVLFLFLGALIGIVFDLLFRDQISRFIKRVRAILRNRKPSIHDPENFCVGNLPTSWLVIDGDGDSTYTPETIKCLVRDTPVPLPPEVDNLRTEIEKREAKKKKNGLDYMWNGPLYALERYARERTVEDEGLEVIFTFRPSDYFTFQATVMSLDVNLVKTPANLTLRQKYIQGHEPSIPIPFLANNFGVVLVIITGDKKLLLARRQNTLGARAGELDVSVVEGVHPLLDRASSHRGPDLYRTAIRGTQEETGIELVEKDIHFLGFGVDMEYYQWNIIGVARLDDTAQQALAHRKQGTAGKWETNRFEIIDSHPRTVFNFLKRELENRKVWSTALVAVYWSLVHEYGRKQVDTLAKQIFS